MLGIGIGVMILVGGLVWGGIKLVDWVGPFVTHKTYLVLLQNNMELRATGGFVGSFAKVRIGNWKLESIEIQDIYEPDGKLEGHVEPPYPVQEAFGQGWWKLRDANWDPDFASAAASVNWFMKQAGEPETDGIIAINMSTVSRVVDILGPIKLSTYEETVSGRNFYQLAQKYAEVDGDKRGFLGMVGVRLVDEIQRVNLIDLIDLSKLAYRELKSGQIWVWMSDVKLQKRIEDLGYGGRLESGWNKNDDYLYIVESNLGTNKANCCVSRMIAHDISGLDEHLIINWKNDNEFETPRPPVFWGGDYRNYVRVIIPIGAKVQSVKVAEKELRMATASDFAIPNSLRQGLSEDMYVVERRENLQIIGFWAVVPAGETLTVSVNYESGSMNNGRILVRRQPGLTSFAYKLIIDGKIGVDENVGQDTFFGIR